MTGEPREPGTRLTAASRSAWKPIALGTLLAAGVLALVALLSVVNPAEAAWLPKCPLYAVTGWHCPGCGITRALHALVHGDLPKALASNPLLIVLLPALGIYCLWQRWRWGPGWSNQISPRSVALLMFVMLVFAVLRNIPAYPFQLLAPH